MNFKNVYLVVLTILTVGCSVAQVQDTKKFPEFSWDTMPLYMHVRKNDAFTKEEITYLSKFPLITFEKTTGSSTFGSTEKGTIEAAKEVKKVNPKAKILYYKNVVINWGTYEEDEAFIKKNPDAILVNDKGQKVFMPNGSTGFYDLSKEKVRAYWLNHVKNETDSPYIDGVFLDANIKVLVPGFFDSRVGLDKQKDIVSGYFKMMTDLKAGVGKDNLLIANIIRVRPEFNDVGRDYLKYFDGSYLEGFDHESFGMTYAEYLSKGIEAFQKSAQEGNVIAMSIGLGEGLEGAVKGMDDIRQSVNLNDNIKERLDYVLAIFLVCAEKYSYVYPHDGYNSKTSAVWLKSFTQYENKLGAPKGPAVKTGYTYKRSFEHIDVTLDIENKTAKLDWK
ncbi:putative glycosyl hydrolase-like family 15 (GHL15) protein [Mariniflexile fucanivorans]|uniref:Putative glycosyl hydrolase-like family 15 (GHL15) protein n=1 Tax=Mariniflexile fucanivorans TaxID=264023 RepID=A0A4R1RMG7_9FLAO|nr:putative glycoside hydrolase [Mariniflexile fucanivorans]TCL67465.1 putative glycosyl hydrolase-like family 15 (GHL15) protein [Mariniflexile fucanivorans]